MGRRWIIVAAVALMSCSGDVRDTPITEIDFTDMASVQRVAQKLEPEEREAFAMYVMNRSITAGGFPGQEIVRTDGKAPATVREAIALSRPRVAENRRSRARMEKESAIQRQRNPLVNRYNELLGLTGEVDSSERAEVDRLKKKIDEFDAQIEALRQE